MHYFDQSLRRQARGAVTFLTLAVTLFAATLPMAADACGVERWSVKTGTDADSGLVNLSSPTSTTIVTADGWPGNTSPPPNNRISPYETTEWVINATLVEYKLETDEDYHLVLHDASGNSMIAEIPNPSCVSGGPFLSGITNARNEFNAKYTPTSSFKTANVPVRIMGVGMFDFAHGQTGAAPNQIELHPVLDIQFTSGTSDFSLSDSPTSLSIAQSASRTSTIAVTPLNGFTGSVALSASGLPSGVTASFSPSSTTTNSTLTLTASSTATVGTSTVTITGVSGSLTHTTTVALTVTSGATANFSLSDSPTSLSVAQSGSGNSTVTVTPSNGFTGSVALSASGLPSGVTASFSPTSTTTTSTMTLTASSTATTGTSTVTITGVSGSLTHTTTLSLTVTTGGGGSSQILLNPGFESASANWTASTGVITNSTSEAAHGGSYYAWLDGYGTATTDTLLQQVAIPSGKASATLNLYLHIDTAETTTTTAYDTLKVEIRNSSGTVLATLATYSNLDHNTGYSLKSFNLNSYIGQTVQVYLIGVEDSVDQTSFVVDDFALNVQ